MKKVLLLLCFWLTALGLSAASYPDKLYLIGNINEWHTYGGVASDSANDGVYTWNEVDLPAAEKNTYSYFSFATTTTSDTKDDWGGLGTRYGATSSDALISTSGSLDVGKNNNAWMVLAGTYKIVLDIKGNKITLSTPDNNQGGGNEGGDEPVVNPTTHTVYFDNSDTKWSTVKCYAYVTGATDQNAEWHGVTMEKVRDNIYSYTSTVEYKIVIFNDNVSNQTGNLTWQDDYIYNKNGAIEKYTEAYGRNYPSKLYIIGDVNNWGTNTSIEADKAENGVYTWNEIELPNADKDTFSYFTFVTAQAPDWDKKGSNDGINEHDRYGATSKNCEITSTATIKKFTPGTDASSANSWKVSGAKYKVVADLSTMTLTLTKIDDIVTPPVNDGPEKLYLHMYKSNIAGTDQLLKTWSGVFDNNVFTFTVKSSEIAANHTLLLSTTEKYDNNTLYAPVDNTNISKTNEGSKFTNFVSGSTTKRFWNIDDASDYTITVNWDEKTFTATKVGGDNPVIPDDPEYGEYYILFDNTSNWTEPCVWAWDTTNGDKNCNADGTYPGDSMKKLSNGLWYWEVPSLFSFPNMIKISDRKNGGNATGDLTFYNKGTYKPNGSQTGGEIVTPPDVKLEPTGTLPVLYINVYTDANKTEFDNEIIDKDLAHKNYFSNAEYWLDVKDCQWMIDEFGAKSIGLDEPLPLEIKARGNFTRKGYSKKPYKIKLGKKQNLLGLTPEKSKHYALLTHADDEFGYMRNFVGFRLGEMIGLPWTPKQQPIEVVINGDYRGIYFLTESIRVGDGRVPITELEDNVSDPALISGGYLVELDNYVDDCTFHMSDASNKNTDGSYGHLMVTADTPEELSALQLRFIRDQFTKMNDLVNSNDDNELWSYLDMDDAARYYVVEEIISHYEAYHGSTYLFRNYGEGQKWHFTPLWDCGHAFDGPTDSFFPDMDSYQNPYTNKKCTSYGNNWIGNYGNSKGLRSKTKFMDKVKNYFQWFINSKDNNSLTPYQQLSKELDAYVSHIKDAAFLDAERWDGEDRPQKVGNDEPQDVVKNKDIEQDLVAVKDRLDKKISFLKNQWSAGSTEVPVADATTPAELPYYAKETYKPKKFYIVNDGNWSNINVYMYNDKGDYIGWYGDPADLDNGIGIKNAIIEGTTYDVYSYIIWEEFADDTKVIFSQKGADQKPGANNPGFSVEENKVFFTGDWNSTATADFPWSGKLPLVRITTPDGKKIGYGDDGQVKKCSFAIDALGIEGYADVFRSKAGDTSVKGRGKSWTELGKNSYKIKTDSKISILGMPKSKHWVLMPYAEDAENALLTNYAGHEMAKLIGLNWTPSMEPVEVILNGQYIGLYFIAENVRAAADRVPIADYGDDQANGDKLTYSKEHDFLLEIDVDHDEMDESELFYSWNNGDFTHKLITKTPSLEDINDDKTLKNNPELLTATIEEISGHIDTHITEVQNAVKNAAANIYSEDWANVIDAKQAVKYYIVQEIMDDARSFTNNFYMHHTYEDTGEGPAGTKWFFGPVWDFSGALEQNGNKSHLIHEVEDYDGAFIKDLYKNRQFVFLTGATFHKFYTGELMSTSQVRRYANGVSRASIQDNFDPEIDDNNTFETALTSISNMAGRLQEAADKDAEVWSSNAATSADSDVADRADALIRKLRSNASYLAANVNEGGAGWNANDITTGVEDIIYGSDEDAAPVYFDLMGRRVAEPQSGNIYIVRRGANVTKEVVK